LAELPALHHSGDVGAIGGDDPLENVACLTHVVGVGDDVDTVVVAPAGHRHIQPATSRGGPGEGDRGGLGRGLSPVLGLWMNDLLVYIGELQYIRPMSELLPLADAADLLGVSVERVRQLVVGVGGAQGRGRRAAALARGARTAARPGEGVARDPRWADRSPPSGQVSTPRERRALRDEPG